jgi:sugar phosphate isomerase/epimerase
MKKMKAGFIGFMPYGDPNVDLYELLRSYGEIGYRGFEAGAILLRGNPIENLKRVQSFGMKPLTLGYRIGGDNSVDELIKNAKMLGIDRVTTFVGVAGAYRFKDRLEPPTYDEIMREIEEIEGVSKRLAEEGITFAFHNHDVELEMSFKGVPLLYLMLAHTEHLKIELDVGWVKFAGKDPAVVMKDIGDRICALHIKDITGGTIIQEKPKGQVTMPQFTTPGTGLLNMKDCLSVGLELGIEWAIVEQDYQYNLTQKETLTAAYLNMKETGLVE